MDYSGNNSSGSVQSSSGCEEEYAESSISAFLLNNNPPPPPPSHVGLASFTHTLPQYHNTHHMFDHLSSYLDQMQRSPSLLPPNSNSSLLNLDMMWSSKHVRSQPNPTDLCGFVPSSSSSSQQDQSILSSSQILGQTRDTNNAFLTTQNNPLPHPQGLVTNNDQPHNTNTNAVVRNSKKRSRASRRAPTTVLTTDTTNFRAMVQEFTGIPAPPFSSSSSFPRNRFDLFGSVVNTSNVRSTHLDPPYLLRPFAQKIHQNLNPFPPPPPPTSSSVVSSTFSPSSSSMLASTNSTINSNTTDHLGLMKQQPFNFNTHNPIPNFQNILQPPQKHPLENPSVLPSKIQSCLEIPPQNGVFDQELGLRHAQVNNNNNNNVSGLHQNMVSSPLFGRLGTLSSGNNSNIASTEWAQAQRTGTITNNDIAERVVTDGKVHYSASSTSNFHGDIKGPECSTVSARNEGMLWVNNCSSELVPPPKD